MFVFDELTTVNSLNMCRCRTEKLNLKNTRGKVKIIGTMSCLAGAIIISLYHGKIIISGNDHVLIHLPTSTATKIVNPDWTRGTIILVASISSYATWFIVQVRTLWAVAKAHIYIYDKLIRSRIQPNGPITFFLIN